METISTASMTQERNFSIAETVQQFGKKLFGFIRGKVKTTEEELEVYELIKNSFPEYNITYKDNLNWFSITLDNTTRKIIAKVKFLKTKNQLIIDKDTFEFKDSLIITPELREAILIKIKSFI